MGSESEILVFQSNTRDRNIVRFNCEWLFMVKMWCLPPLG
jgi:hypothetical protein